MSQFVNCFSFFFRYVFPFLFVSFLLNDTANMADIKSLFLSLKKFKIQTGNRFVLTRDAAARWWPCMLDRPHSRMHMRCSQVPEWRLLSPVPQQTDEMSSLLELSQWFKYCRGNIQSRHRTLDNPSGDLLSYHFATFYDSLCTLRSSYYDSGICQGSFSLKR